MKITITSDDALDAIETLRLPGESASACVDRVLSALRASAPDFDVFFGPQTKAPRRKAKGTDITQ